MIPRRIIQTHRSLSSAPPLDRKCIARVKELHADWEVLFFSDGDCLEFVRSQFPHYLDLYQWYPKPVMRADLFRILAVYALGGFYLDTDMWITKSLDPLCRLQVVFPWEVEISDAQYEITFPSAHRQGEERLQVGNYAFGAEAKHPFLKAILAELVARTEMIEAETCRGSDILFATGPDLVTTVKYRDYRHSAELTLLHGSSCQTVPAGLEKAHLSGSFRFGDYGTHLMSGTWK